jgi:hypothetical protein
MNQPPGNAKPANAKPANAKPVNAKPANAKPANAKPANAKPLTTNVKPTTNAKPSGNTLIPPSTPTPSSTNKNKNASAAKAPGMMNRFKSMFGKKNNTNANSIIPKNLRSLGITNTNVITKMRNKGLTNAQIQNLIKNPDLRKASSVYTAAINNIRKNTNINSNNVKTNSYGTSYASYAILPIATLGMILFLLFGLSYFIREGQPQKK